MVRVDLRVADLRAVSIVVRESCRRYSDKSSTIYSSAHQPGIRVECGIRHESSSGILQLPTRLVYPTEIGLNSGRMFRDNEEQRRE